MLRLIQSDYTLIDCKLSAKILLDEAIRFHSDLLEQLLRIKPELRDALAEDILLHNHQTIAFVLKFKPSLTKAVAAHLLKKETSALSVRCALLESSATFYLENQSLSLPSCTRAQ